MSLLQSSTVVIALVDLRVEILLLIRVYFCVFLDQGRRVLLPFLVDFLQAVDVILTDIEVHIIYDPITREKEGVGLT